MAKLAESGGVNGLLEKLNTNLEDGIKVSSISGRRKHFGGNVLPEPDPVTFFGLLVEALGDSMLQILIGAAIVSLILGLTVPDPKTGKVEYSTGWIEGAAILTSVVVVVTVTAWNDYSKAQKFAELNKKTAQKEVIVKRGGQRARCDISEVVVGDILTIGYGDILGADGIYVSGEDIVCDESAQTGESHPINKNAQEDPFFLAGALVIQGGGEMLVTGVGESSCNGKLAAALQVEKSETPLQEKLGEMANSIGFFGLYAAIATFIVLAIKELYFIFYTGSHNFHIKPFLDFVIVAVTIVVVAIPEGLPLAVTISLAYSMKQMQADNCLVRVLAACETMGGATTICSDKTGTLTCNKMSVVRGWIGEKNFDITPPHSFDFGALPAPAVDAMCESLSLNSTAEEKVDEQGNKVWDGNKTEQGLLRFVKDTLKFDYMAIRKKYHRDSRKQWPFNSEKKRMTTMIMKNGKALLLTKGAPEIILQECTSYLNHNGQVVLISSDIVKAINDAIDHMAQNGNRVLMVVQAETAFTTIPEKEPTCSEYTCIGLLGVEDPVRPEVPGAVAKCQGSGILVRMVTGDNVKTATSIAKQCGIYQPGGLIMEGQQFRETVAALRKEDTDPKENETLRRIIERLQVLARSSPEDKQVLTKLLQDADMVVAVTGDGTNDGPALKMANVGFSMNTGTDIAKAASDIVLMDDNFVSVVKAVMWGRNVNDNIKKFIQFQVTVNVVGVFITFVGAAFDEGNESPLSPVQLLWVNLIMDTLAALALATEQPVEKVLLSRKPEAKGQSLITGRMWLNILGHAIFQITLLLWLLNSGAAFLGVPPKSLKHLTIYFNTFILIQIWNEFNARKLAGETNVFSGFLTNSRPHAAVTLLMVLIQVFAVQCGGSFMHTTPLNLREWIFCTLIGSLCIPYGYILNHLPLFKPEEAPKKDSLPQPVTPSKSTIRKISIGESPKSFVLHRRDTVTSKMCQGRNGHILVSKERTDPVSLSS
eukprot:GGOE01002173.1.p1 GENE.GGOE01002173.1~~GGOE01002173.1.p1  ORF type:complete len:1026 (-),score=246.76 GGOE01002173.1:327-3296(-)